MDKEIKMEFEKMDAKFEEMNEKMNARFEEMSAKFEKTLDDFAIMVARGFAEVDRRFVILEKKMDDRFAQVDERFVTLEKKMDDRFSLLDKRIDALKENTARREDYFINESGYTKRRLDRIEKKVGLPPVPMAVRDEGKEYSVSQKVKKRDK